MANNLFNTIYNPDVLSCIANLSNDEVFTPPEVANAMLDMLPQELFEDPNATFLEHTCGQPCSQVRSCFFACSYIMLPSSVAYFSFSDFNNHEMDDRHYGKISENNGLSSKIYRCEKWDHRRFG